VGRNDSCDTATTISNGTIRASISPYADIDVYSFQGTVGKAVEIETYAQRLDAGIYLDTLLELLDASCLQLSNNDDFGSNSLDSFISYGPLPYSGTYYIRVTDVRGDGRPDFPYELHLSGAE
jgi:hypothetical protein